MKFSFNVFKPAAAAVLFTSCSAVTGQTTSWQDCAQEGQFCAYEGAKAVRYGENGVWVADAYAGGVSCNNATFGDPLRGTVKRCQVADLEWQRCARERRYCAFEGEKLVRYGNNGTFNYGRYSDGVGCRNGTFGDPLYGVVKVCDIAVVPSVVETGCGASCVETTAAVDAQQNTPFELDLADYVSLSPGITVQVDNSTLPPWLAFDSANARFVGVYDAEQAGLAQFQVDVVDSGQLTAQVNVEITLQPQVNSVPAARQAANAAFVESLIDREANFLNAGVGYNATTGLTHDGYGIDAASLELQGGPRFWTTASKESLHVNILVKALLGDPLAQRLVVGTSGADPQSRALSILTTKIATYEDFNERYPSYGGYMPWVVSQDRGAGDRVYPSDDWIYRAPALDNGQLAWAMYLAHNVLGDIGESALAARYKAHFDLVVNNGKRLFFNAATNTFVGETRFGTAAVADPSVPPEQQNYFQDSYLLNDSLEGELYILLMLLFSDDLTDAEKAAIWSNKAQGSLVYSDVNGQQITAHEAWVFSSHEQWKYLVLPYTDNQVHRDLFVNAQKIRADYALRNNYPGFFAAIHDKNLDYLGRLGIPGLGTDESVVSDTVAPYATFPVLLSDTLLGQDTGLLWYQNLLSADRMVGPYGVTESIDARDLQIAPLLTWDNKGTSNIALMGGMLDETRRFLIRDNHYTRFLDYLAVDLQKVSDPVYGVELPIRPPEGNDCEGAVPQPANILNIDFECDNVVLGDLVSVANPQPSVLNGSETAGRYTDPADAWSSLILNFGAAIDLSVNNQLKIKVLAPVSGILKAKLEAGSSAPVELDAQISQVGEWVEYSFDFGSQAGANHQSLVIFFNAGVVPQNEDIYYVDDIRFTQ